MTDASVTRAAGVYYFTGTCATDCGITTVRIGRRERAPLFIEADVDGGAFRALYKVRCSGPRGVSWTIRVVEDTGTFASSGFFRMPRCGPWRPDATVTLRQAREDAQRLARRASRDDGYAYETRCDRTRPGGFRCQTGWFVGDLVCERRYRIAYEHRSGDESQRRRATLDKSACYPA